MADVLIDLRIIKWLKPIGQRALIPVRGVDYIDVADNNGWLYVSGQSSVPIGEDNVDMDSYIKVRVEDQIHSDVTDYMNEIEELTTETHVDFPEYKILKIRNLAVRRDSSALVEEIKSKEAQCNNILMIEGQFNLANVLATQLGICLGRNDIPTREMRRAEIRFAEIAVRIKMNRSAAVAKIAAATNGDQYSMDSDWQIDTLSPLLSPFNDLGGADPIEWGNV